MRIQSQVLSIHARRATLGEKYSHLLKIMHTAQKYFIVYIFEFQQNVMLHSGRDCIALISGTSCALEYSKAERGENPKLGSVAPVLFATHCNLQCIFKTQKLSLQQQWIKVLYTLSLSLLGSHISTSWNLAQRGCFFAEMLTSISGTSAAIKNVWHILHDLPHNPHVTNN